MPIAQIIVFLFFFFLATMGSSDPVMTGIMPGDKLGDILRIIVCLAVASFFVWAIFYSGWVLPEY